MVKILVVDDEPHFERLILQRFRRKIREKTHQFVFALNGQLALQTLAQQPDIDMVLSDINMPQMDGLTLVAKINELYPMIKTVIVSAYGDMDNIRKAMNLGAYDFVTKPIDFEDLETTINKTLKEVEVLKRSKLAKELAEKNENLKELDQLKTLFFTNITHEFRTPLTVILGMAEQIKKSPEKWLEKGVTMIQRNGNGLLNLISQMLDLSKLEAGKLHLNMVQGDVIKYLKYIAESFHSLIESKSIRFHFLSEDSSIQMDYDPDKLLSIISNLLSNAIKFTPEGGNIYLIVGTFDTLGVSKFDTLGVSKTPRVSIKVKDSGQGIPEDQLPYIFDRFYQAEGPNQALYRSRSSGIGLALTKELVKLFGGDINVESQVGEGTTFLVSMPISRNASPLQKVQDIDISLQVDSAESQLNQDESDLLPEQTDEQLPRLLIVEDSSDVAQFLVACLEGKYLLDIAWDGQEGIEKAIEQVPDIIISDVMMPRKDGLELCQTLKTDPRTSHIPIILLTAKVDIASRIKGLERGADAYLPKPFEQRELFVRLEKLLELRRNLHQRYASLDNIPPSDDKAIQQEDEFIIKVQIAVNDHLDDENFGITELCREVGLSRTQVHHKIKALTGRSTSHYVRSIRLHKAKKMLETTDLNVSEIAYEVGFRDPKYFSRTYRAEFGQNPKEVRN